MWHTWLVGAMLKPGCNAEVPPLLVTLTTTEAWNLLLLERLWSCTGGLCTNVVEKNIIGVTKNAAFTRLTCHFAPQHKVDVEHFFAIHNQHSSESYGAVLAKHVHLIKLYTTVKSHFQENERQQ